MPIWPRDAGHCILLFVAMETKYIMFLLMTSPGKISFGRTIRILLLLSCGATYTILSRLITNKKIRTFEDDHLKRLNGYK